MTRLDSLLTLLGTPRERRRAITKELSRVAGQDRICRLMMTMPGLGPRTISLDHNFPSFYGQHRRGS